jgi:uncharacterized alkaline shock family protein YloU
MRVVTVIGIMFYSTVVTLIGGVLIIFSLNFLQPSDINKFFEYLQYSPNSKIVVALSGALLIIISYFFAQLILGKLQRERTIAFSNTQGEVTIALSAVEDLIRRLTGIIPEIKELRPDVIVSKKGLLVDIKVILKSEVNIPDLTSRLQVITKNKIQEVLGIDEQINIRIHVAKITPLEEKGKSNQDRGTATIPYSGYTRV